MNTAISAMMAALIGVTTTSMGQVHAQSIEDGVEFAETGAIRPGPLDVSGDWRVLDPLADAEADWRPVFRRYGFIDRMRVAATLISDPNRLETISIRYAFDADQFLNNPAAIGEIMRLIENSDAVFSIENSGIYRVVDAEGWHLRCGEPGVVECFNEAVNSIESLDEVGNIRIITGHQAVVDAAHGSRVIAE